ncbi:MAG TPA: glucose-6-phosphate dehydrogenase [Pseudomonadales bacterium]
MSEPCRFVIFGAAGHLARTKLLPSLYDLECAGRLADGLSFTALARREMDTDGWRAHLTEVLAERRGEHPNEAAARRLAGRFDYLCGDHQDPDLYRRLRRSIEATGACRNVVFYLAVPPNQFRYIVSGLADAGLNEAGDAHRIVVEKPFGHDVASARALNAQLRAHYRERQIYRIDHYLGKETVQNLFVFRFANSVIEPLWNRHLIDHVQIILDEQEGIDTRAGYYDQTGALRDMVQSHLLQVLSLVAMEPPAALDADQLQAEKVKVLRSIRPLDDAVDASAVRGRYAGYLQEPGVAPDSSTETYVAMKLWVDNWRWHGVPFYLRTGKRLAERQSRVAIRFRDPPQQLFRQMSGGRREPNWLILSLQPEETIHFELQARQPGLRMSPRLLRVSTAYRTPQEQALDAYATLLLGVIEGDRSLFIHFDEVQLAWQVLDPLLRRWEGNGDGLVEYQPGTWGPEQSARLFERPHQHWRNDR